MTRFTSMKLSVMFAIPAACYKQKGDRHQNHTDNDDTDGPDPRRYRIQEGHKTRERENIGVNTALVK